MARLVVVVSVLYVSFCCFCMCMCGWVHRQCKVYWCNWWDVAQVYGQLSFRVGVFDRRRINCCLGWRCSKWVIISPRPCSLGCFLGHPPLTIEESHFTGFSRNPDWNGTCLKHPGRQAGRNILDLALLNITFLGWEQLQDPVLMEAWPQDHQRLHTS